jgi:choice-of-anchor C domain-containing protein
LEELVMFKRALLTASAIAMVALTTPDCKAGNLIINGGFEDPVIPDAALYGEYGTDPSTATGYYGPTIPGWTIVSGNVDVVTAGLWAAYEGNQSLDLNGLVAGEISESFATDAGESYTLSFAYANDPYGASAEAELSVTGTSLVYSDTITHGGSTFGDMDYDLYSTTFTADSTSTTLDFASVTPGAFGLELDAVSVTGNAAVPEPSSFTLAGIAGVTCLGVTLGRRKRT